MSLPHYTRAQELPALLQQRIAILDGAMGTMIQRFMQLLQTRPGHHAPGS